MYLLNLTLAQFLAVFGAVTAFAVALYLLDRSRRRQVVSTLQFWVAAEQPAVAARRRRLQQPWSLILQLLGMGLLLLAVAQLRLGSPAHAGRDHVIVLDTSAWMAAHSGNRTLMDIARDRARRYLRALPARDRVMLIRADGLATPATAFEPDHSRVEAAILASKAGPTALHLEQALTFARHAQSQQASRPGEIAYIGPARTVEGDAAGAVAPPRNLRVLMIPDAIENCGLRRIGARRSATDPDVWQIFVLARNYGSQPRTTTVSVDFGTPDAGRLPAGSRALALAPGSEKEVAFEYRTAAAGILRVHLSPRDAFPDDNQAELELPSQPSIPVTVYSNEPDLLRPALSSSTRVTATFRKPAEFRPNDRGLVILDRFIPPQRPTADSIWIDPPAQGSPIVVRQSVQQEEFQGWNPNHPAAAGLRAKDFKLEAATVFAMMPGDVAIGEVQQGPVIVARPGKPKIVAIGFHPALSGMRYELAMPLLFANLLRWLSPEIFRRSEITGGSVGAVRQAIDPDVAEQDLKVTSTDGSPLPFTLREHTLEFFSGTPGSVRVSAGDREFIYSLSLPQLWEARWTPPQNAAHGIPSFTPIADAFTDLWPWLAIVGAAALFAEWMLFGRFRRTRTFLTAKLGRRAAVETRR